MLYLSLSFVIFDINISLQSFCIPGPIFLSLIGGALYGRFWGFLLVTFVIFFLIKSAVVWDLLYAIQLVITWLEA